MKVNSHALFMESNMIKKTATSYTLYINQTQKTYKPCLDNNIT